MPSNEYSFRTVWIVEGTREELYPLIEEIESYARWWPSVWLKVECLKPGDEKRIGSVYAITSKGWLPYLLHWTTTTVEKHFPERIVSNATGDFVGQAIWTFKQQGPTVELVCDWNIRADKPLLKKLSFLFKPFFAANHNWAMRMGLESLKLELARRRATSEEQRAGIPPAPKAVFWFGKPKVLESS
ncbi:MAG TPA: SRPBCC family protein [Gemmataceae bacterium]|nr:SRPBCC family protein [Gemmataceae bacterium]